MNSQTRRSAQLWAVSMLAGCTFLWGLSFTLTDLMNRIIAGSVSSSNFLTQYADTSFYLGMRFILALLLLWVTRRRLFRALSKRQLIEGLRIGAIFGTAMIVQSIGLFEIVPSRSAFLTSLSILFTPLLVVLLHRKLPPTALLLACVIATLGSAILTEMFSLQTFEIAAGNPLQTGDVLTLVGSLGFSWAIIEIDRASDVISPETISPGMFLAVIACCLPGVAWAFCGAENNHYLHALDWLPTLRSGTFWGVLVLLSFFCTLLPFHLMNIYQHYLSPTHAALLYTLEPIFATLWSMFLPGLLDPLIGVRWVNEQPAAAVYAGGGLILLANLLILVPGRAGRQEKQAEQAA